MLSFIPEKHAALTTLGLTISSKGINSKIELLNNVPVKYINLMLYLVAFLTNCFKAIPYVLRPALLE